MITGLKAVEVDGRRLEYYDVGAGPASPGRSPALVMMHGGMCSASDYEPILPRLATRYRCILPDGLLTYPSPWDVWLLLDHLGIEQVAIMGHSQGGNFVHEMYRLAPERVWAWVDIDCAATGTKIKSFKLRVSRYSPGMRAEFERRKAARPEGPAIEWEPYLTDEGRAAMRRFQMCGEQQARGEPCSEEGRPTPAAVGISFRPTPAPLAMAGKYIACPLLQLNSGRGRLRQENIRPEWVRRYINAGDVEYVVVTDAGHWIWLDQPEIFLRTVEDFLSRHTPMETGARRK